MMTVSNFKIICWKVEQSCISDQLADIVLPLSVVWISVKFHVDAWLLRVTATTGLSPKLTNDGMDQVWIKTSYNLVA